MKPTTGGMAGVSDENELLTPEAVMPAQLGGARVPVSPERKLCAALIEDALRCAPREDKLGREARAWFVAEREDLCSFKWCIAHLGGNPDAAAETMRKRIEAGALQRRRKWLR